MLSDSPTPTPQLMVVPYALWTAPEPKPAAWAQAFQHLKLPALRAWVAQSQRRVVAPPTPTGWAPGSLSLPHERVQAHALGWRLPDGALPWAALRAAELGRVADGLTSNAPSAWGFVSLCHWQVSHGQVILGDPAHLAIDAPTDERLFNSMAPFFAEDGLTLYRDLPGRWLVHAPLLAEVTTASLDRVVGRNIDPWLVGGESPSGAAKLLRRLQNEMQMLLYTHAVNESRAISINSFWLHGTGAIPAAASHAPVPVNVVTHLRESALQQDLMGWFEAWQRLDEEVLAPLRLAASSPQPPALVLCGEHEHHVYDRAKPGLWQRFMGQFKPLTLETVLTVAAPKE